MGCHFTPTRLLKIKNQTILSTIENVEQQEISGTARENVTFIDTLRAWQYLAKLEIPKTQLTTVSPVYIKRPK